MIVKRLSINRWNFNWCWKKSFDGGLEKESEMRDAAALNGEGGEASASAFWMDFQVESLVINVLQIFQEEIWIQFTERNSRNFNSNLSFKPFKLKSFLRKLKSDLHTQKPKEFSIISRVKSFSIDHRVVRWKRDCESLHLTVIQYANQAQHQNQHERSVSLLVVSLTSFPSEIASREAREEKKMSSGTKAMQRTQFRELLAFLPALVVLVPGVRCRVGRKSNSRSDFQLRRWNRNFSSHSKSSMRMRKHLIATATQLINYKKENSSQMPKLFPILAAPHFANNSPLVLMFFSFRSKPTCVGARRRKTSRRSRLGVNSKPRRRRAKQDVRSNRFSSSSIRAPAFMNMKDFFSSFASHQTLLSQKELKKRSRRSPRFAM